MVRGVLLTAINSNCAVSDDGAVSFCFFFLWSKSLSFVVDFVFFLPTQALCKKNNDS